MTRSSRNRQKPATPKATHLSGRRILFRGITGRESLRTVIGETFLACDAGRLREACRLVTENLLRANVTVGLSLAGALALIAAVLLIAPAWARAGGGPENVAVVVNADSWASLAVANAYVALRRIPPGNVIYVANLPSFERVTVDDFRSHILGPVLRAVRNRRLTDRIDCIAYSSDLPHAVDVAGDVGKKELPKYITKRAAINGLTYLHDLVMARDIEYLDLGANYYVRRAGRTRPAASWTSEDQAALRRAVALLRQKRQAEAETIFRRLAEDRPDAADLHYNLACCLALQAKAEEAVAALERAVDAGWANATHTQADEDLESLRNRKDFKRLLEKMKQPLLDLQPSVGFRSAYGWSRRGQLTEPGLGRRYMLSTMLAVTSGRGNSVREAIAYLRRSVAADGSAPAGTVYFLQNSNVRSRTRAWAFRAAAKTLQELGVAAEILDGRLPTNKPDVAGAVIGTAVFDWKACGSTILPGAICDHLTSMGGVMTGRAGQTPLTEFLRHGAAGASGTVTEPMAIQAKFPLAFMHVHYARGCSLAEAFYQSVAGPYQLLIVGDPLCRPWARIPEVSVKGAEPWQTVKGRLTITPGVKPRDGARIGGYDLLVNGDRYRRCRPGESFEIDTTSLADGYYDVRIVATTADAVATQGRLLLPLIVNNKGQTLAVTPPQENRIVWGSTFKMGARLKGAREIRFLHNARVIGTIEGDQGEVEINTVRLGLGPVEIQAVGHIPAGPRPKAPPRAGPARPVPDRTHPGWQIAARPVDLEIIPPPPLPAVNPPGKTAKGLKLTPDGGPAVAVIETGGRDWLAKAGLGPGRAFTLEGYFDVPDDDMYQFQVRTNGNVSVKVDGRPLKPPRLNRWTFLPVSLAAGTHLVRVSGRFAAKPSFDLRFGGPGAMAIRADDFRHAAASQTPESRAAGLPTCRAAYR